MNKVCYSDEECEFVKSYYLDHTIKETATAFNEKFDKKITYSMVKRLLYRLGMKNYKDAKIKKGNTPWNKGICIKESRPDVYAKYMEREYSSYNGKRTWFRPCPIGTEREHNGIVYIKAEQPDVWKTKASYLYEKYHNVKLKKGEKIMFLNGNKKDFSIENLEKVNNAILAKMNKKNSYYNDIEMTRCAVNINRLELKIKEVANESTKHNAET